MSSYCIIYAENRWKSAIAHRTAKMSHTHAQFQKPFQTHFRTHIARAEVRFYAHVRRNPTSDLFRRQKRKWFQQFSKLILRFMILTEPSGVFSSGSVKTFHRFEIIAEETEIARDFRLFFCIIVLILPILFFSPQTFWSCHWKSNCWSGKENSSFTAWRKKDCCLSRSWSCCNRMVLQIRWSPA